MASIIRMSNGRKAVQFNGLDGKRPTIRLGKCSQRNAETVKRHVEALVAAAIQRTPPDDDTSKWVRDIGDALAEKLAAVGLIASRAGTKATVRAFIDGYIDGRGDLKPGTRNAARFDAASLFTYFGDGKLLRDVTPGDADDFAVWLKALGLANATIGRRLIRAKQFFRAAVRRRLVAANPFDEIKPPVQVNEARKAFITAEQTERLLAACPDAQWRLIVALSRYGGIRCPSETLALTWGDVDWERGRIRIPSPKTEHLAGGASREIPLFPELRPHLEAAFEQAEPGTVHVVTRARDAAVNLRTHLLRIIRRAALKPWPKPFHNLRASRETELAETYPIHVVCDWIGNTARIADKHYLQVTDDHFGTALQRAAKSDADSGGQRLSNGFSNLMPPEELFARPAGSATVANCHVEKTTRPGFEQATAHSLKPAKSETGAAKSDANPTDSDPETRSLDDLAAALLALPEADRQRLAELLRERNEGGG